ncbi:transglutaminase [Paenibacillus sp. CAA11]|uniref:transglutaminase domain-containing protein n=1 Tax=Paenibacillus sp. CAA11 TaxID=1532905 RepID=UPI000D3A3DB8|nr:transglutaminase domain-containing protein [Paenibacillus sp. CAA11]AWB46002.1 transglutaminase [Paenibacillus sp. CAA11]
MKRLRFAAVQVALASSMLLGATTAGAVGDQANTIAAKAEASLTSIYQVQQRLTSAVKGQAGSVTFKYKGNVSRLESMLDQAVLAALDSDPYIRYIIDRYTYKWRGTSSAVQVTVTFKYRETPSQTAYVNSHVKQILKKIIKPSMNDHQKVKAIHDWVVLDLKYDTRLKKYTAYEGLTTGEAVCQGYALLTYKLLQGAGINNKIVEGTAGDVLHAWNLVKLDGRWYHLDTTWDDPVPDQAGQVSYSYYLLTDSQIGRDHFWTKSYPAASTSYRNTVAALKKSDTSRLAFYNQLEQEVGYDLYQSDQVVHSAAGLQNKVKQAIKAGSQSVTVRYNGTDRALVEDLTSLYDLDIDDIMYYTETLDNTNDIKVRIEWK